LPPPMTLKQLDEFLAQTKNCYQVTWTDVS
jgi:hypothetical protein